MFVLIMCLYTTYPSNAVAIMYEKLYPNYRTLSISAQRLAILTAVFCAFTQSLQVNARVLP
jgi:hypothetical protein